MNILFKALGDPTRRQIIELLRKKDMNAGEIADHFNMSKPSISHHLDLLRQADVVQSVKEGQFVNYALNTTVFDEMVKWIMDISDKKNKTKK
ncbi:MAG: winged helix-turn-helix transcriptional regulator [Ferruginibacter sp.]|nr:winged helix-turn-helix transcriptional regulator [Ferruginibacter sp.]